jgi:CHAT domain-containing protein
LTEDKNSLSLYDIYTCDLGADLTLLTACESGRPGYQDGEGMVSLAHAFNYAGSQRILTALWKVDEQSSNVITEFFVQNLKHGDATDIALQKAKLRYLQQAEGRLQAPAYWAGLVIMGEPAKLAFNTTTTYIGWIVAALILIGLTTIFIFIKSKNRKDVQGNR